MKNYKQIITGVVACGLLGIAAIVFITTENWQATGAFLLVSVIMAYMVAS